ncbi:MAG: hypothetical protein U1E27_10520 [Kiritimatiellia bacterium]|nr:hypothetical protein [Kiritimatiellia bacterium]
MPHKQDISLLRELAKQVAEIAALDVQQEKRAMWRRLNGRTPDRPMVMIDQVCWNEMNIDGELTLLCEDAECRAYEERFRRTIFQWKRFPVDGVVESIVRVPKAIRNSGFGLEVQEDVSVGDPTNSVVGHRFNNQFERDEDLEKIRTPVVTQDAAETNRRLDLAHSLFDGVLTVEPEGYNPGYMSVWDPISFWMGVEGALYAIIDRPEFMARLVRRVVSGYLALLDQLEALGLLCEPQPLIHCTGGWTDDLPAPGFDARHPRVRDLWMFSMAQMFSTVSPAMHDEFEIEPCLPIYKRFGLVYYGCCEPLDKKMDQVRRIPNLRKVSMSPWVNEAAGAEAIGGDYVYSRKPNPALLAWPSFDETAIREHLRASVDICARYGCPLELILKDISTVAYEPKRLFAWARLAMDVVQG